MGSWLSQNQFRKLNLENSKYTNWGQCLPSWKQKDIRILLGMARCPRREDYTKGNQRTQRPHQHHLLRGLGPYPPHLVTLHPSIPHPSSTHPDITDIYHTNFCGRLWGIVLSQRDRSPTLCNRQSSWGGKHTSRYVKWRDTV